MLTLNIQRPNITLNVVPKIAIEEIRMDQTPTQSQWALIPLYKESISGETSIWQIGFDGTEFLEIVSDDKIERIPIDPKQALQEARKRYRLKYRTGFQPPGPIAPQFIKGMKGYDYKPNSIKSWPVYTQPKINGIRMLSIEGGLNQNNTRIISMKSWLNNSFTNLGHIEIELREFFEYLPRYSTLDGELYNHRLDFSDLRSAVKTTTTVHPLLHTIQYCIFDINYEDPEGTPFEKRYALLINAFNNYVHDRGSAPQTFGIVPSQIARNHDEVQRQHDQHVAQGYEGIMIKKISNGVPSGNKVYEESLYRQDKGNHILKYKQFFDEEVIILRYAEVEEIPVFLVRDKRDNLLSVHMLRNSSDKQVLYRNSLSIIGKQLTIRYQEMSETGVPKSPVGLSIRDYE